MGQLVQSLNQAGSYLRHTKPSISHEVTAISLLCSVVPDEQVKPNPPACESVYRKKKKFGGFEKCSTYAASLPPCTHCTTSAPAVSESRAAVKSFPVIATAVWFPGNATVTLKRGQLLRAVLILQPRFLIALITRRRWNVRLTPLAHNETAPSGPDAPIDWL